jgi:hypothetical protein
MPTIRLHVTKANVDSQELGSSDEHMVSRFFMTIDDGQSVQESHVDVKQVVGSRYTEGQIEVGPLAGYRRPYNHGEIRERITDLYRRVIVGPGGLLSSTGGGVIRLQNLEFGLDQTIDVEADRSGGTW